jgi:hypothetical protein
MGQSFEIKSLPDKQNKQLEVSVKGYPETIQWGDPVYLICTFTNKDKQVIENVPSSYTRYYDDYRRRFFQCDVIFTNNEIYRYYPEDDGGKPVIDRAPTPPKHLYPSESIVVFDGTCELPPLEDWQHTLWRKFYNNIGDDGTSCNLRFTTSRMYSQHSALAERTLTHKITIKRRQPNEIKIINDWFYKCGKEHFPVLEIFSHGDGRFGYKYPGGNKRFTSWDNNFIQIGVKQVEPYQFIRVGNRKPPMHICPQDWQGWQELEESFAASTLRDEIRWTRICIPFVSSDGLVVISFSNIV